jgi:predicted nucleic acid-binding protein
VIVIDATAVVAAIANVDAEGSWAGSLMRRSRLVAPQLVLVEVTHGLRNLEHRQILTANAAASARRELGRLAVELFPFAPFSDRVWELRKNLTAYDAWYVALAEAFELPLATLDQRLAAAPGPKCQFLTP